MYNEHHPSILVTFWGETEHFSGKNGALRWSILVGKQKHNEQKPTQNAIQSSCKAMLFLFLFSFSLAEPGRGG